MTESVLLVKANVLIHLASVLLSKWTLTWIRFSDLLQSLLPVLVLGRLTGSDLGALHLKIC